MSKKGGADLDIDAAQNRESERRKLTVSVQYRLGIGTLSLSELSNQVTGELVSVGRRVTDAPGWGEVPFNISHLAWIWFYIHQAMFRSIISLPGSLILERKMFWWEAREFWSLKWDPVHWEWVHGCLVNISVNWVISTLPCCSDYPWVLFITDSCYPTVFRSSLLIESHVSS